MPQHASALLVHRLVAVTDVTFKFGNRKEENVAKILLVSMPALLFKRFIISNLCSSPYSKLSCLPLKWRVVRIYIEQTYAIIV